ncbi:MAG: ABC transporter permease [Acidobacteria bacterium]|nr:ABC transporter permease [Acidobacteriota bacterium]
MKSLWQDLRYGFRMLVQNPGFTAVAVLTLGLGIGANTAIFSVVNAVLLKPLSYANAERLTMAWENNLAKGWSSFAVSPANFLDWQKQNHVFDPLVAFLNSGFVLTGQGEPEMLSGMQTTDGFFRLTGVEPALGRAFRGEEFEAGKNRVVILSHALWQRRFEGSPEVLDKAVTFSGESYTVLGVMPKGYRIPQGADLLAPLTLTPDMLSHRGSHYLVAMGRLKPGVTLQQAQSEMSGIATALAKQYPNTNTGWNANLVPLYEEIVGEVRPALLALFAAVGFVLLIACGNVTNLLLARGASRQKEIALRAALGAGRIRIIRQLLTESMLLALAGGAIALLVGQWGVELLRALQPANLPRMQELGISSSVLLFTFALSLVTGLVFGSAPALLISRSSLSETLKEGGRGSGSGGRHRLKGALVIAQVALSLVLLVGAGLQIRSFLHLMEVDPGFDSTNVLTMGVSLPDTKYTDAERQTAFIQQALENLKALPGVKSAAAVSTVPLGDSDLIYSLVVEGRTVPKGQEPSANWYSVSPDYFQTLRIALVRGRVFTEHDDSTAKRVAVINESLARRIFPGEDPIGRQIRMGINSQAVREIVGIVKDVKHYALESRFTMQMYEPYRQQTRDSMVFLLRTDTDPASLTSAARRAIFSLDKEQPVSEARTLEELVSASASQRRFNTLLIGFFAVVALVLAAVGIYGVVAYSVAQRTHEIGVRMALGAQKRDVFSLVLRQGMVLVVTGVILGLAGAMALTRLISQLLFNVSALDAATFLSTPLLLAAVALLACYLPARRASRVDPMVALRYE